jgi:hypothetical protein
MTSRQSIVSVKPLLVGVGIFLMFAAPAQADMKRVEASPENSDAKPGKKKTAKPAADALKAAIEMKQAREERGTGPKRKKKIKPTCKCGTSRILRQKDGLFVDTNGGVTLWLHQQKDQVALFVGGEGGDPMEESGQTVEPIMVPFPVEKYGKPDPSPLHLFQVGSTEAAGSDVRVALLKGKGGRIYDRVGAQVGPGNPPTAPAPSGIWLGPRQPVDHEICGAFQSLPLRIEEDLEDKELTRLEGFVVVVERANGEKTATIMERRQAAIYGVGRVPRCAHGMTLPEGEAFTLTLFPLGPGFVTGDPWVYQVPAEANVLPLLVAPFPGSTRSKRNLFIELRNQGFVTVDSTRDKIAFGSMVTVVGGASVVGGFLFYTRRRRRRRFAEIECPECTQHLTIDLLDPNSDGMFCIQCGSATIVVETDDKGRKSAVAVKLSDMKKGGQTADEGAPDEQPDEKESGGEES